MATTKDCPFTKGKSFGRCCKAKTLRGAQRFVSVGSGARVQAAGPDVARAKEDLAPGRASPEPIVDIPHGVSERCIDIPKIGIYRFGDEYYVAVHRVAGLRFVRRGEQGEGHSPQSAGPPEATVGGSPRLRVTCGPYNQGERLSLRT